jgi:hypothetical protein
MLPALTRCDGCGHRGLAEWDMNSSEVEATLRGREMIVALDQCATPIAARRLVSSGCIHEVHFQFYTEQRQEKSFRMPRIDRNHALKWPA